MSRALMKRVREIQALGTRIVGDLGYARRPLRLVQTVNNRRATWMEPVEFREREFACRTHREVGELALERFKNALISAIQEIRERHGNPEYGFSVTEPVHFKMMPGWTPDRGDYVCFLRWEAPAVETPFWPHPIPTNEEPVSLGTDADEAAFCGLDLKDYRRVTDPDPDVRAKVGPPQEIVPDEPNGL